MTKIMLTLMIAFVVCVIGLHFTDYNQYVYQHYVCPDNALTREQNQKLAIHSSDKKPQDEQPSVSIQVPQREQPLQRYSKKSNKKRTKKNKGYMKLIVHRSSQPQNTASNTPIYIGPSDNAQSSSKINGTRQNQSKSSVNLTKTSNGFRITLRPSIHYQQQNQESRQRLNQQKNRNNRFNNQPSYTTQYTPSKHIQTQSNRIRQQNQRYQRNGNQRLKQRNNRGQFRSQNPFGN